MLCEALAAMASHITQGQKGESRVTGPMMSPSRDTALRLVAKASWTAVVGREVLVKWRCEALHSQGTL